MTPAAPSTPPPTAAARGRTLPLVIGCGNEHRHDDGCGVAVARALRGTVRGRARVVECDGEATALLDLWEDGDLVVVVDAVRSGRPVGSVQRMEVTAESLPASFATTSTHGLSLAQAVALGRSLGRFPNRLVIYGVEAGELGMGVGLTPAVARAVDEVTARIERELAPLLEEASHA